MNTFRDNRNAGVSDTHSLSASDPRAIIFDLDGVIIDSEGHHSEAFVPVAREYGFRLDKNREGIYHQPGIPEKENWRILKERYCIAEEVSVLMEKRSEEYCKIIRHKGKMRPGLDPLLRRLHGRYVLAIASASLRKHIDLIVDHLGIRDYFSEIISGCELERSKPFPDIYLEASRRIGIPPGRCIAIEDSETGVLSAKRAGMKVIAVPTRYSRRQDFRQASIVLPSLASITADLLVSLR